MKLLTIQLSENKKAFLNVATVIVAMLLNMCVGFFLSPYIVENMGVEANGFIQLATNFTMYAGLISIALNSMGGRFISLAYHKGEIETANSYYSSMLFANIIIGVIIVIPSILIILYLDSIFQINADLLLDAQMLFSLVFLNFFFTQSISLINVNMFVSNKLYISNVITSIRSIFRGIVLLTLFTFFPARMFFTSLTSVCISVVLIFVYLSLKSRILPEIKYEKALIQFNRIVELIKSGVWNTVNQAGNILMTGLDLLITNIFIDPIQMGILATSKVIPGLIIGLGTSINSSLSPRMMISYAREDKSGIISQIDLAARLSIFSLIIPITLFVLYGNDFYQLWMPSLDPMQLWRVSTLTLLAYIPLAGTQTLYNVLSSLNRLSYNSITFLGAGLINVVVVYFVLKYTNLGILAVAGVSSIITIIRNLVVILPYVSKLVEVKCYEIYRYVLLALMCSLLSGIIIYVIKLLMTTDTWLGLVFSGLISLIIITVVNFYAILKAKERQGLITVVVKLITK